MTRVSSFRRGRRARAFSTLMAGSLLLSGCGLCTRCRIHLRPEFLTEKFEAGSNQISRIVSVWLLVQWHCNTYSYLSDCNTFCLYRSELGNNVRRLEASVWNFWIYFFAKASNFETYSKRERGTCYLLSIMVKNPLGFSIIWLITYTVSRIWSISGRQHWIFRCWL